MQTFDGTPPTLDLQSFDGTPPTLGLQTFDGEPPVLDQQTFDGTAPSLNLPDWTLGAPSLNLPDWLREQPTLNVTDWTLEEPALELPDGPNADINGPGAQPAIPTPDYGNPTSPEDLPDVIEVLEIEVPLEVFAEIFEEDVPLSEFDALIIEPDVPLSQMPQTGLADTIPTLTSGLIVALMISAVVSRTIRKLGKKEAEDEQ